MKVKVTYTVDYDEVPNLMNELVNRCRDLLKRSSEFSFDITRFEKTEQDILELQETLDLVATQLDDCLGLCRGYISYQEAIMEQSSDAGEQDVQSEEG